MKKQLKWIIAALAVTAVATPALAEDGIKFYGSVRVKTNYIVKSDGATAATTDQRTDDATLALQPNSRFGVNATTGAIGGKVEMGFRQETTDMYTRLLYGTYKTEGGTTILVGQTYAPYWTAYGHVYKDDDMFTSYGNLYEGRIPMIRVDTSSGLYMAAIKNAQSNPDATATDSTKTLLPKLNVGFKNTAGALTYNTGVAYQQYDSFGAGYNKDIVVSYLGYFEAVVKSEAMTAQAKLHYGQNLKEFGFTGLNKGYTLGSGDNIEGYGGVAQLNVGKACAGFSYTVEDADKQKSNKDVAAFVNYTIVPVKGFSIVPELAYFDYNVNGFDFDGADEVAATIKWQMDF